MNTKSPRLNAAPHHQAMNAMPCAEFPQATERIGEGGMALEAE